MVRAMTRCLLLCGLTMELEIEVLEAAATWYVRFGAEPPNDGERQAWREWLEADPRHRRAWERIERLQGQWRRCRQNLPAHAGRRACAAPSAAQDARPAGLRRGSGWLASGGRLTVRSSPGAHGRRRTPPTAPGGRYPDRPEQRHRAGPGLRRKPAPGVPVAGRDPRGKRAERSPVPRAHRTRQRARAGNPFQRALRGRARAFVSSAMQWSYARCKRRPGRCACQPASRLFDERRGSSTPLREGEGSWTQGVLTVVDWPLGEFIAELSRYRAGCCAAPPRWRSCAFPAPTAWTGSTRPCKTWASRCRCACAT